MKVGIVGFGSIGTEVAKALIKGVEDFTLCGYQNDRPLGTGVRGIVVRLKRHGGTSVNRAVIIKKS